MNQNLVLMNLDDMGENNLESKFYNPLESSKSETQQILNLAFTKITTNHLEHLGYYLNYRISIRSQNCESGLTILHIACQQDNLEAVFMLIKDFYNKFGKNYNSKDEYDYVLNIEDFNGNTALDYTNTKTLIYIINYIQKVRNMEVKQE